MKDHRILRNVLFLFVFATIGYALTYRAIEHRRVRNGPWVVTFTNNASAAPVLIVNQPRLAITNLQIIFSDQKVPSNNAVTVVFAEPHAVPFGVPFGRCVFFDPLFLPGTVTLELFGHEIQLMPRVLTIDKVEHPWVSNGTFVLMAVTKKSTAPK